jgi:hypothetical protein
MPSHPISLRPILISSTHLRLGQPSGLSPSDFPNQTFYQTKVHFNLEYEYSGPGSPPRHTGLKYSGPGSPPRDTRDWNTADLAVHQDTQDWNTADLAVHQDTPDWHTADLAVHQYLQTLPLEPQVQFTFIMFNAAETRSKTKHIQGHYYKKIFPLRQDTGWAVPT